MASVLEQHPLKAKVESVRKSIQYEPSYWGDFFIRLSPVTQEIDSSVEKRVEELKREMRKVMRNTNEPLQKMNLVDAVQRLGLGYDFEEEIDEALKQINDVCIDDDLHAFALWFRLLRQWGYNTPSDGFNKFTNEHGKFNDSLNSDAKGLLSLYEAAHLALPGEDILDEAVAFTMHYLPLIKNNNKVSVSLAMDIERALYMPLRKGMARLQARQYISIYEKDEQRNEVLLELAKLDCNRVQRLLQKELKNISLWWKELALIEKLRFARDRLVECYYWALGVCPEPHQSRSRRVFTKTVVLTSVLDDIYDHYGTIKELTPFNDVIQRWDMEAMKQLPDYMQIFIHALADIFEEFEKDLSPEGNSFRVDYLKKAMKNTSRFYLQEAIWGAEQYVPTFEERLSVSVQTSGYPMLHCATLVGLEEINLTKEVYDWVTTIPKLVYSIALHSRLMDDIVDVKIKLEEGQVISTVQCYALKKGISEQEACVDLQKMIKECCKTINEELLKPSSIPIVARKPALNLNCVAEVIYKSHNSYDEPSTDMKDNISALLVNQVPII
ncbi:putative terpene synthase 2 [Acorus calamus]|uniref:Terpene synthase 2 n=1 Tax=Acorus calamus TaxID=4465 RepID=A0AAV9EAY3_ACOCL|nr:putative terpene synthase 2 [Acorus calamus]